MVNSDGDATLNDDDIFHANQLSRNELVYYNCNKKWNVFLWLEVSLLYSKILLCKVKINDQLSSKHLLEFINPNNVIIARLRLSQS